MLQRELEVISQRPTYTLRLISLRVVSPPCGVFLNSWRASSLSTFSCTFIAPAWSPKLWLTSSISHISLLFSAQGPEFQVGKIEKEERKQHSGEKKKPHRIKGNKHSSTPYENICKFGDLLIQKN